MKNNFGLMQCTAVICMTVGPQLQLVIKASDKCKIAKKAFGTYI
jgi:hypothetical protein